MKIICTVSDDELAAFLRGVVGVVKANSYETMCLWREYHEKLSRPWGAGRSGLMLTVGELADMPVAITLYVNEIDGHRILFLDATSQVVDHRMIEKWMEDKLPPTAFRDGDPRKGVNKTNAMNFHNVFPRPSVKAA